MNTGSYPFKSKKASGFDLSGHTLALEDMAASTDHYRVWVRIPVMAAYLRALTLAVFLFK